MSKEHIFSQAVGRKTARTSIAVVGMANMRDGPIGPDWPKARILCQHHNSSLSLLDDEAKKLADGLHSFADGAQHTVVHLNGLLLERWALKTIINHMAAGLGDANKWLPNDGLVRNVFGLTSLPNQCGLYLQKTDDYNPLSPEQAGVTPTWRGLKGGTPLELVGASLYLHGATFFILLQAYFLEVLKTKGLDFSKSNLPLTYDRLTYHPIATQIHNDAGHTLTAFLDWPSAR